MDTPDPVPVPSFPSGYEKRERWLGQVDALTVSHVKNVVCQGLHRHLQILVRTITAAMKRANTRSLGEKKGAQTGKEARMEGSSHVTEQQPIWQFVYLVPKFECWSSVGAARGMVL